MSRAIQYEDRMSESDTLLWNNERDPMLRSTIISVQILDRLPDRERFHAAIRRALGKVPRLRQRVVLDPLGAAPPRWETDPHFDLAYHTRTLRAAGKGSLRDLLDLAEPIGMQAFDKDRPLWELYVVDGLEHGGAGIVMKLHHSVSDGVGLVRMTSSLVERTREPDPGSRGGARPVIDDVSPATASTPFENTLLALQHRARTNLSYGRRAAGAAGRGLRGLLRDPRGGIESTLEVARSLGRALRPVSEPLSPLMTGRSLGVRYQAFATPLADLKAAGNAAGGTLNDAFVAAVTGGLRRYHALHGAPVSALRMTMPINLRAGDTGARAGNQFAPARFPVPIDIEEPLERMTAIRALVAEQRSEASLPFFEEITGVLGRLPGSMQVSLFGSMLKAIDFVTSNVPGPPFEVFASGARVEHMFGFGPLSGAAANITLFSYNGELQVGVNLDRAAVPDPDAFVECLRDGFAEVLAVS